MTTELEDQEQEVSEIYARYQFLLAQQYNHAIEWQELADYILPRKNSILVNRVPGYKRTQRLFDSTAPADSDKLAASIHSTLTPSFTKWFHLEVEDEELNKNYEVRLWLELATKKINAALNKSNFNSEAHEAFIDLVVFGTACLYEDERSDRGWFGGLHFTCVPISKYVVSEDAEGRVDTIYRSFPMSLHAIKTKWPDSIPDELLEDTKKDQLYEIIHAVRPTQSRSFQNYMWDSQYVLSKFRRVLSKRGYYNFPYMVPRWTKYPDESYGRGPSHTALPDIRTLNKLTEMELRNLAKLVDPPIGVVSGDIIGPARMVPGGLTTTRSKEGIFKIDVGGNYQVANLQADKLKESIHQMYYADQLQMANGPQMTATEVNARFELMQRIMGPVLGRLESELTKPLLNRTFSIMYRAGLFNPIPQALQTGRPVNLKIQYEGSLARAQRSSDVTALTQFEQLATPFFNIDPGVKDVVDFDEAIRHLAAILDVPSKVIRDTKQVKIMRDAEQKQMEQQQQMQQMEQTANAGKAVSPMLRSANERVKPGSLLEKLQNKAA